MKTVLNLLNNNVMKNAIKYICALLLLVGVNVNAWGTTETFNFATNAWQFPSAYGYGTFSNGSGQVVRCENVKIQEYPSGTYNGIQLKVTSSEDAILKLPLFPGNVSKIEVYTISGASTEQNVDLYVDGVYISWESLSGSSPSTPATFNGSIEEGKEIELRNSENDVILQISRVIVTHDGSSLPEMYKIIYESEDDDLGLVSGPEYATVGETVNFTLTPKTGESDGTWVYDETYLIMSEVLDANVTSFTMPAADISVHAYWKTCTSQGVIVSDEDSQTEKVVNYGVISSFDLDYASEGSGAVTWSSTNPDVATVVGNGGDGAIVTIVGAGTTNIKANVAADATYCAGEGIYELTVNSVIPTVTDFTATPATNSITLTNAQVSNKGGAAITEYGYIYSTTASTAGTLTKGASGVNAATVASTDIAASTNFAEKVLSGLTENTHYYIRAYATNAAGTGYSDVKDVKTVTYTDYVFSCAALTLTGPSGDLIFITSAASKTVRSQEAFHVLGSGLTPNTTLTFAMSDPTIADKFAFKQADGSAVATNASGAIDMDFYVFYTPASGDTEDGLDRFTNLSASVSGTKPKTSNVLSEKTIIGRHLPADFVIAAKNTTTNKWYALPANMAAADNPIPSEIAVDDIDNPTIAYTANSNYYSLYGNDTKQYIQFGMTNNVNDASKPFALWANNSDASTKIGKSSGLAENSQGANYQWLLTQTNTSITNPQDAKYTISNPNNSNALKLWLAAGGAGNPKWGLYEYGISELRLIPASDIVFTEAYFVEWAQHGGVVEVDAQGVAATSVVAHLGEATSSAITLVQTKANDAKNKSSKYNYTVNFGGSIDFAAAASNGAMLTLEWKNGETTKAMSNIIVPKIVASDITINKANYTNKSDWNTEVHVLPGKTVTVDPSAYDGSNVTIKELNIYPGATVVASTGTLITTNLVLRNGWSRAGSKTYDVARLHVTASAASLKATNVYADWYIDYDQYYPIAVPWNATVANFSYRYCSVEPSVGPSRNIRMRYYDGASRATNVQEGVGSGANWKQYGEDGNLSVPTTLTPSTGYAMTAKRPSGKAFSIIRMPLTLPSGTWGEGSWTTNGEQGTIGEAPSDEHKDQIAVTAWGTGSTPTYAKGWNLIANPYMSLHQGAISYTGSGTLVTYVNIPDVDFKEYDQKPTALTKLAPASAFLIKAPETGTITFGTENRKSSAPSYRKEEAPESVPEQQAYIVLSNEQSEDMMGILVSEKYTSEYETNADLEKLLSDGNTLRTYMRYGDMNMAYVAINEMLAKEWIPVSVRIPADGEYTFSLHEASIAGELEGVFLIDYQNGDKVTNLIEQSYTFSSTAGTINGRFAINAKTGERQTPTGIDAINAGGDINSDKPFKFIYHDKVYIWLNGVIYDTTGKRVK